MSLFANGLAIWQTFYGKNPHCLDRKLDACQEIIEDVQDYMEDNGFELPAGKKTQAAFFSTRYKLLRGTGQSSGALWDSQPRQDAKFL